MDEKTRQRMIDYCSRRSVPHSSFEEINAGLHTCMMDELKKDKEIEEIREHFNNVLKDDWGYKKETWLEWANQAIDEMLDCINK